VEYVLRTLHEHGLLGLAWPTEYGGRGASAPRALEPPARRDGGGLHPSPRERSQPLHSARFRRHAESCPLADDTSTWVHAFAHSSIT